MMVTAFAILAMFLWDLWWLRCCVPGDDSSGTWLGGSETGEWKLQTALKSSETILICAKTILTCTKTILTCTKTSLTCTKTIWPAPKLVWPAPKKGHTGQWSWFPTGLLIRWADWGPGQVAFITFSIRVLTPLISCSQAGRTSTASTWWVAGLATSGLTSTATLRWTVEYVEEHNDKWKNLGCFW